MNILYCYIIYIILIIFSFITPIKYNYIYLLILLIYIYFLEKCSNNIFINILIFIFIIFNFINIYLSNLDNKFINLSLVTLILIILIKYNINYGKSSIIINIFLFFIYFYIINFTLKINKFILKNKNYLIKNNPIVKKNNIRVALCLSGRIDDNIEKIYNNLKKNLLDHYNVDIFMNVDKESNLIKKIYKPKKYVVFNKLIESNNYLDNVTNTMFYRIYECNKYSKEYEEKNNFKYDLIIRLRVDINLYERLYLDNFFDNNVYFPMRSSYGDISHIYHLGVTDQFFIANRELMDKTCSIYNNIPKIKCKIPEVTLLYYFKNNSINYKFFNYNWIINLYDTYNIINYYKVFIRIKFILNKYCWTNFT